MVSMVTLAGRSIETWGSRPNVGDMHQYSDFTLRWTLGGQLRMAKGKKLVVLLHRNLGNPKASGPLNHSTFS